jgi:hypothetical protein
VQFLAREASSAERQPVAHQCDRLLDALRAGLDLPRDAGARAPDPGRPRASALPNQRTAASSVIAIISPGTERGSVLRAI